MFEKLALHFLWAHSFISHLGVTTCLIHNNILECELRQQMCMHLTVAKLYLFYSWCFFGYCHCKWYTGWQFISWLGMVRVSLTPSPLGPELLHLPFAWRSAANQDKIPSHAQGGGQPCLRQFIIQPVGFQIYPLLSAKQEKSSMGPDVRAMLVLLVVFLFPFLSFL